MFRPRRLVTQSRGGDCFSGSQENVQTGISGEQITLQGLKELLDNEYGNSATAELFQFLFTFVTTCPEMQKRTNVPTMLV